MSELVERVARAIRDNIEAALPDDLTIDYSYAALAAIEAMREPSEAMEAAAKGDYGNRDPWNTWHAMIDEALKVISLRRPRSGW